MRWGEEIHTPGNMSSSLISLPVADEVPLANELESFVCSVRDQTEPVVTGQHGLQAIDIAMRITEEIHLNRANYLRCREAFEPRGASRLR